METPCGIVILRSRNCFQDDLPQKSTVILTLAASNYKTRAGLDPQLDDIDVV
jgi:hypothetical protein